LLTGTVSTGLPSSSAEYEISHMDPATASGAIFFKLAPGRTAGACIPS
jgi:hypothetical protein